MAEANGYFPGRYSNQEDNPLLEELKKYRSAGVRITLKDAEVPLDYIARMCGVREKGAYMCDFIADEQNQLVKLNFDRIGGSDPAARRTIYLPGRDGRQKTGRRTEVRHRRQ